ncbi:hypothetical protein [Staphylococcus edaphicus]|uniref:Uncharacterized protein n=1 Tax=Staphylococcus edaphicus TaxID=1955013 RepID=A0A2C6WQZ5_9STAP|nr:hypothetical protein [Staphylococcus edaphicus]PHK50799.1 hypothetical protein BTJ66_00400 [Staphylococcus edaphicus]UQW82494.1 hypothetical protein MNY58_05365 [Staphylococcus edaphicus]
MPEINARQLLDAKGEVYFPFTHVTCVEGIPEDIADFDVGTVKEDVSNIQSQIANLQSAVANIPTVTDTGWQNISFLNGAISYDTVSTPKARLFSVNGVYFLSLKGAFKGLTSNNVEIGRIPSSMTFAVKENKQFSQSMSVVNNMAQFTRMRVDTNGTIKIERATVDSVTSGLWFPIDITIML